MESSLKGLQVELSETCALCLSRLLSLICVPPRDTGPQLSDVASVSPPSDDAIQPTPSSQLHLLFKLDCCLEDVNVFTLSNLAGKYIYLHVPHHLNTVLHLMIAPLCPRYLVGPKHHRMHRLLCSVITSVCPSSLQEPWLCGRTPSES